MRRPTVLARAHLARRSRPATRLGLAAAVLAPGLLVLATSAPAAAEAGSPSGGPATDARSEAAARAQVVPGPVPGGPEGFLFGRSPDCRPTLELVTARGTTSVPALDQGWYAETGAHDAGNTNIIVGTASGYGVFRNFVVFDTTEVVGTVAAASLLLTGDDCRGGAGGRATLRLSEVSTPSATLRTGHTDATDIYADLGHGTAYGRRAVRDVERGVQVTLNAAARAALSGATEPVAIGGRYWEAPRTTVTVPGGRDRAPGQRARFVARVVGAPDDAAPRGTVTFRADGRALRGCEALTLRGTIPTATCTTSFGQPGRHRVVARYSGGGVHAPAAGVASTSVSAPPPSISATLSSTDRPSSTGWYAAPVTVRFSCSSRYRLPAGACPTARRVARDGARSVRAGVVDPQGQRTRTTTRVKVDTTRPWLRLARATGSGGPSVPTIGCGAGDRASGLVAPCAVRYRFLGKRADGARRFLVTASATDRADNTRRRQTVVAVP